MINHVTSLVGEDSQSLRGMGSLKESASQGPKPEPDENLLNLLKIMSLEIRSSLLSMVATLKLLNRGYYGTLDEEVANRIKDLLSSATRLTGIAEACLGNEDAEIAGPNTVMEHRERNARNKQVSMEIKGEIWDGHEG